VAEEMLVKEALRNVSEKIPQQDAEDKKESLFV